MHRVWILALAVAASGCSAPGRAAIEVGAVYPTGGGQGRGGVEELRGVRLAAELAASDVAIRVERADSAEAAPGAVRRLVDRGVPVVVGSYGSTISRPAAATAARLGAVFWETGAVGELTMDAEAGERTFRVPATGRVLGREAVAFVRDRLGPLLGRPGLRFAVAYVDDPYGRSVGAGAIAEAGDALAVALPYSLADADWPALAARVADSGADVLAVASYLDDGVALRRAVLEAGVPLAASIGTSSSYCMPEFGRILGDAAVGVFASDKPDGDVLDPRPLSPEGARVLRWGRETYRKRFGEPMSAAALSGFAGGWALFGHVLPKARARTADGIAAAARRVRLGVGTLPNGSGLHFAGPGAPEPGANLRAASVIWEWVRLETREVVWPPAYSTHAIVPPA